MQMYDVQHRDLYRIKSQSGRSWPVVLVPGESLAGLGGVQVIPTGHRVIVLVPSDGRMYDIDYDLNGRVISPRTPEEIGYMIKDLTEIGCYEYTPDLLRAIQQRKTDLKPWEVDHRLRL